MIIIFKKILKLLNKRERRQLNILFGAIIVSGIIEVVGIASILPFLSLVTDSSLIDSNRYLNWLFTNLGFQSTNRFIVYIGAMVLVVLIVSNVLILLTNWGLYRFSWMRNYTLSKRLLSKYFYQPYIFYLKKNTSELGKNILSEVQHAITGVIIPLIQVVSRSIVAIFIFATLLVIEPLLALSIIVVFGGGYGLIYRVIKNKLNYIGKMRFKNNSERFKAVNECFGDIKLIKLMGLESFFINRYSKPASDHAKNNATNQIIGEIPRYIMEIFAFGSIIVVVLYLLATAQGFQEILPLVGIFTIGAYRIMPSLQKIFNSVTRMRFNLTALDTLYDDMHDIDRKINKKKKEKEVKPIKLNEYIKLENIIFYYSENNFPVIKNLNLKIKANTSIAFAGETGAGKTTIANIILGLLRPNEGKIKVDGIEIDDDNLFNWQRNLGYIPQDIYLYDDNVIKNIAFGVPDRNINMGKVKDSARIANIHDFIVKELMDGYDTKIGERGVRLSGGQRQRLGIARALYNDPDILVLDEATSALDGATEKAVFDAINNIAETKTLIIIAHRLTTVKYCDVIYVLDNGEIVGKGKYDELIESNKEFRRMAKIN